LRRTSEITSLTSRVDQLEREPVFDPATGEEMDTDRPMIWTSLGRKTQARAR
jgi:hypothetical protein